MWRIDNSNWRFQTDRKEIAHKLKRRKGFREITLASHPPLWIFDKSFERKDRALRCLESLTGSIAKWDEAKEIFYAEVK